MALRPIQSQRVTNFIAIAGVVISLAALLFSGLSYKVSSEVYRLSLEPLVEISLRAVPRDFFDIHLANAGDGVADDIRVMCDDVPRALGDSQDVRLEFSPTVFELGPRGDAVEPKIAGACYRTAIHDHGARILLVAVCYHDEFGRRYATARKFGYDNSGGTVLYYAPSGELWDRLKKKAFEACGVIADRRT